MSHIKSNEEMEKENCSKISTEKNNKSEEINVHFLVVGGGIAGVTCAETLAVSCPDESILLLTESNVIKIIANLEPVARYLYKFEVRERVVSGVGANPGSSNLLPSITTIVDRLDRIEANDRVAYTFGGRTIKYNSLCLCTGASPHLIANDHPRVLGIRDTDSVVEFQRLLRDARRIVLVGNGGIASELAHELHDVEVHWVVKDNHIASTFVDPGAAHFFEESRKKKPDGDASVDNPAKSIVKRLRYGELATSSEKDIKRGAALGPDWHRNFELSGKSPGTTNSLIMHYKSQVQEIITGDDEKLQVKLTTGEVVQCDFVVSATGVEPRHEYTCEPTLELAEDGGIAVNEMMETNVPGIYAAGDCCTAVWPPAVHWFQMRLWTQARQMGGMAGRAMAAAYNSEEISQDFCFEIFGHVTQLFDYQVVLLGRYNGQGLGTDCELLLRSTPGMEYIKFVLQAGRLQGAILIGNTDLAETCENLILNGIDLTPYGDDILNPDIDIEDYFD